MTDESVHVFFGDTETEGLFGQLRLMAWVDEWSESVNFWTAAQARRQIPKMLQRENSVWYFHNLEFDAAKMLRLLGAEWTVDWATALIINHEVRRCRLRQQQKDKTWKTYPMELADTLGLFAGESLARLSKSFGLTHGKMELSDIIKQSPYRDAEEYFAKIPVTDTTYRNYLARDVLTLRTLWQKLREFSGLDTEEFIRCPTMASLSMRYFRKNYPESYEKITTSYKSWRGTSQRDADEKLRKFYIAARTNVFRPVAEEAYHYDVNGLYNYVMGKFRYPIGPMYYTETDAVQVLQHLRDGLVSHAFICCDIDYPETFIPILPVRTATHLLFPVGRFHGYFTGVELLRAIDEHHVTLTQFHHAIYWLNSSNLFSDFAEKIADEKAHSTGARRAVFKGIGNANYGKYGMKRLREEIITQEDLDNFKNMGEAPPTVTEWVMGYDSSNRYYLTDKWIYAPYVHLGIAAHITAYARLELWTMLDYAEKYCGGVYYCDTDSVVTRRPIPERFVHESEPGKWKLERSIVKGLFLQPKLYAEVDSQEQEILKSKGLVKEWRQESTFNDYVKIMQHLQNDEDIALYENIPQRQKMISAYRAHGVPDAQYLGRKTLRGQGERHRHMLWAENTTLPLAVDIPCGKAYNEDEEG